MVEAYETLSDPTSRRIYDQTGQTVNSDKRQRSGNSGNNNRDSHSGSWWNFHFYQQNQQGNKQHQSKYRHKFMFDRRVRAQGKCF